MIKVSPLQSALLYKVLSSYEANNIQTFDSTASGDERREI